MYLQPALEEIIKTPYQDYGMDQHHNGIVHKFIINVNGKEVLCTYGLDTSFSTGWHFRSSSHAVMSNGVVEDVVRNRHNIARRVNVRIEPYKAPGQSDVKADDDFHPFEKAYAAVPSGDWYNLVPFEEFDKQESADEDAAEKQRNEAKEKMRQEQKAQKQIEEDRNIKRVP